MEASAERISALARAFPARPGSYGGEHLAADRQLFVRAWTRGLTTVNNPAPPPKDACLRVVAQERPPGDGVSEAGASGAELAGILSRYWEVEPIFVRSTEEVPNLLLEPGNCFDLLISNSRRTYPIAEWEWRWRPDLHVALWNPFTAATVPAPSLLSYGFRTEALQAVLAWLQGEVEAAGRLPAPLS